jgi:hypothetical protein
MDTRWLSQHLRRWHWVVLLVLGLVLVGCSGTTASSKVAGCSSTTMLNGAGSTFDAPLFTK